MDPLPVPCLALYEGADTPKPAVFNIFEEVEFDFGIDSLKNNKKLWNPQDSDDKIQLPHLPQDLPRECTCLLSGKPTIPGCIVLLVEPIATVIWYCRLGEDDEWMRHEYDIGTQPLLPPLDGKDHEKVPICSIAACRGKFYLNSRLSDIGVLEFSPAPVFSSLELAGEFEDLYRAKAFLVESDDELYMVIMVYHSFKCDNTDYETRVYKMDFSEQRWNRVDDLAGRAFLLAPCKVEDGIVFLVQRK
ncbi:hypothetical protein E2562_033070 [Oryza meyeriana var. granulata]|uniref:KIB1-4 beta-propeller domain-containing protein n=1 Tax=Oryza meyeriana var. granulata TaxID=110450 RepID=A0A6G1DR50_9ORYZ|nr:hypothetical protein E2562_033070 [Oryza meyeriana var. granulata]